MGSEQKQIDLIKKIDKNSFELLFKSYYAPLCLFAHKYLDSEEACEDVVQSFFVKLWKDRKTIHIQTSLKSYLYSSIRNRCLNQLKHQKIKRIHQEESIRLDENYSREAFLEIGLMEKIESYIQELPEKRREIFILSREHGLKYREIAEKLGISIKTVETQMGHALKSLREKLKEYQ